MNVHKNIRKYVKLFFVFARNSLIAQMQYRFNFFTSFFLDCIYLVSRIIYVVIIYQTGVSINGWTSDGILLHIGIFNIMSGIYAFCFVGNFFQISNHIVKGTLDLYITKPVSSQFMLTLRSFDFGLSIPDILGGVAMVVVAWYRLGLGFHPLSILGFIALMLCGIVTMYSVFLLPHIISFWSLRNDAMKSISDSLFEINSMPMIIYNKAVQVGGLFILPLLTIASYPSSFLQGKLSGFQLVWAFIVPVVWFSLIHWIWKKGIDRYNSAS